MVPAEVFRPFYLQTFAFFPAMATMQLGLVSSFAFCRRHRRDRSLPFAPARPESPETTGAPE
jgi:hypothetical protein